MRTIHSLTPLHSKYGDLLREFYRDSLFLRNERKSYRINNELANWGLDCRVPLLSNKYLSLVAGIFSDELLKQNITQVIGTGCAGSILVSAIVATQKGINGGYLRSSRKEYGFREIVEGNIDRSVNVAFIDDIFSSGQTFLKSRKILASEGIEVEYAASIFSFGWRNSASILKESAVGWFSLAKLQYIKNVSNNTKIVWNNTDYGNVRWLTN